METLLFRIRTADNPNLSDDEIVTECMEQLMRRWPQVKGYQYERQDDAIHVLMWGDLDKRPEEEA